MAYYGTEMLKLRNEFFASHSKGDFKTTVDAGEKIIQMYKDKGDCSGSEYAHDLNNLAIVYDDAGDFEKASKLFKEALDIKKNNYGEESSDYADTLSALAVLQSRMSNIDEAEKLHAEVLKIREKVLGQRNKDTVIALFNLSNANEDLDKIDIAIDMMKKTLSRARRVPDFPLSDLSDIYCCLGRQYGKKGIYKKAAENMTEALRLCKETDGENNFHYIKCLRYLSTYYTEMQKYDTAAAYQRRAVKLRGSIMSKTHLDYITCLNNLAEIYNKSGNYEKAIETHKEVLNIIESILGKNHNFYVDQLNNMAKDYSMSGDFIKAEKYARESLEIRGDVGKENGRYILGLLNFGQVYIDKGDLDKALSINKEAMDIMTTVPFADKIYLMDVYTHRSKIYNKMGDNVKAQRYALKAMRQKAGYYGKNSREYADAIIYAADIALANGDFESAIAALSEAVRIKKDSLGDRHPEYADVLYKRGTMNIQAGKYSESSEDFEKASNIYFESMGIDYPKYAESAEKLIDSYYKNKSYFDAINCCRSYIDITEGKISADKKIKLDIKLAKCYYHVGDINKSEKHFISALKRMESDEDSFQSERGEIYNVMGDMLFADRQYTKAIECYSKALRLVHGEPVADININCGLIYVDIGDNEKALWHFTAAQKYFEDNGLVVKKYADVLNEIARIYSLKEDMRSYEMYKKYLSIVKEKGFEKDKGYERALCTIAGECAEKDDAESTLECLKDMEQYYCDTKEYEKLARVELTLAIFYSDNNNNEKAEEIFEKAYKTITETENTKSEVYAEVLKSISEFYLSIGNTEKAEEYSKKIVPKTEEEKQSESKKSKKEVKGFLGLFNKKTMD